MSLRIGDRGALGLASARPFEPEDTHQPFDRAPCHVDAFSTHFQPHLVCTVDRIILGMHTADLGFELYATAGTAEVLRRNGVEAKVVRKLSEGEGPNGEKTIVQMILDREIDLVVNTPHGTGSRQDGFEIRTAAVVRGLESITTIQGLAAAVQGIESSLKQELTVHSLQEYASRINAARAAGV